MRRRRVQCEQSGNPLDKLLRVERLEHERGGAWQPLDPAQAVVSTVQGCKEEHRSLVALLTNRLIERGSIATAEAEIKEHKVWFLGFEER